MESMRDVLRHSLGRSLEAMEPLDRLAAAWPVACGRALAARGTLLSFADGVLRVRVDDDLWLKQLFSMRHMLESELSRIAAVKVTGIHFEREKARR